MICGLQVSLISVITLLSPDMELLVFGRSYTRARHELWRELHHQGWVGSSCAFQRGCNPLEQLFMEPGNYWGWKRPLRTSRPTVNLTLPSPLVNIKNSEKPWEVVGKWLILQFLKGLERPLALGLSTCSNSRNSPAAALDVSYLEPVWKNRQLEQDTEEKRSLR